MKFVCDSCGAQYMIADDKVGPKGVKVRCKKCSHVILVQPAPADAGADATVVLTNPLADLGGDDADATTAFEGEAAEAEIGAAFDTIFGDGDGAPAGDDAEAPASPEAGAAAPGDPFSSAVDDAFAAALAGSPVDDGPDDHAATRVFTTHDIQRVAQEREIAQPEDDEDPGLDHEAPIPAPASASTVIGEEAEGDAEWFAAIHEEQVGPLTPNEIQDRWESGDLSPDSLVWKNGMADWAPLSQVDALKDLIVPTPASPGYTAPEPEPELAPAAAAPAEDEAPEWKPAAASLLASLAAEEMEALDKQEQEPALAAPTADPVALPPEPAPAPAGSSLGLDLNLPPPPAPPPEAPEMPAAPPGPQTPAPLAPAYIPAPAYPPAPADPAPRPPTYTGLSAAAAAAPRGHGLSSGRLMAVGGGLVVLTVGLVFGGLALAGVFSHGGQVARAEETAPAKTVAAKQPPPAPAKAPAAAKAPAPAAGTPAPKAVAVAAKIPAKAPAPEHAPAPEKAPAPKPRAHHETRTASRRSRRHRAPRHTRERPTRRVASAAPEHPAARHAASSGSGDSDLEAAIFGDSGSGGSSSGGGSATKHQSHRPAAYIPPAPGSGRNLPRSLGQGEIIQVVAQHTPALRQCTQATSGAHGRLVMSWRIRSSGRTSSVTCVTRSLRHSTLCSCIGRIIRGMHFPPYGGPQMPAIEFPFNF